MCANWFDYVWAYFKVMVDVKTEQVVMGGCGLGALNPKCFVVQKLRTCSPATGQPREVLPSEYWNSMCVCVAV